MNQQRNQLCVDIKLIEKVVSRIFPSAQTQVEHIMEGISTNVYRIVYRNETFYLRLRSEVDESFAAEVVVHTRLRQMQVCVPEVIYFEHYNAFLQRSVMVTTEIRGRPLSQSLSLSEDALQAIVLEAGRDLARVNSLPIDGFGRVTCEKRNQEEIVHSRPLHQLCHLCALWPTHRAFMLENWDVYFDFVANNLLSTLERDMLRRVLARYDSWLDVEQSHLVHGDFSVRHIYQENGQYTGLIDFGDIRGASSWYDLAHFHMYDGARLPYRLEPFLVRGYGEITMLPADHEQHIRFISILTTVRILARVLQKYPPNRFTQYQLSVLREDLVAAQRYGSL